MSQPKSPLHRSSYIATGAGLANLDAWRMRALRHATAVRRMLRSAGVTDTSAVGEAPTLDALKSGMAEELLLTTRFIDMNPDLSATALELARQRSIRVTMVTGVAALELDLVAGGIGAVLRRSASRRWRRSQ